MSRRFQTVGSERLTGWSRGAAVAWNEAGGVALRLRAGARAVRTSALVATSVTSLRVAIWVAGITLVSLVFFFPHNDANQNAHTDLAVALVEHQTVAIDP